MYRDDLRALLSPAETNIFKKLKTPEMVQTYLEALPQNFSYRRGEAFRSPRRVLKEGKAYCLEGAFFGAASLAYFGQRPLIMDIQTSDDDTDHVVALFRQNNLWGAISKTNHAVLRWRDPIYKTVRELAMSYFHEYFLENGKKTMLAYSRPFDLSRYKPERWVTAEEPLDWLAEKLDESPHFPVAPTKVLRAARKASHIERVVFEATEWTKNGKRIL